MITFYSEKVISDVITLKEQKETLKKLLKGRSFGVEEFGRDYESSVELRRKLETTFNMFQKKANTEMFIPDFKKLKDPFLIEEANNIPKILGQEKDKHMQAGILMMKKCDVITSLINEWYDICSNNYHLIDDSPSIEKNFDNFIENRHDQSIYNLLVKKENIDKKIETLFLILS